MPVWTFFYFPFFRFIRFQFFMQWLYCFWVLLDFFFLDLFFQLTQALEKTCLLGNTNTLIHENGMDSFLWVYTCNQLAISSFVFCMYLCILRISVNTAEQYHLKNRMTIHLSICPGPSVPSWVRGWLAKSVSYSLICLGCPLTSISPSEMPPRLKASTAWHSSRSHQKLPETQTQHYSDGTQKEIKSIDTCLL